MTFSTPKGQQGVDVSMRIKDDIVASYEILINDCKLKIQSNINVDNNMKMLHEYEKVLKVVEGKTNEYYDDILKQGRVLLNRIRNVPKKYKRIDLHG